MFPIAISGEREAESASLSECDISLSNLMVTIFRRGGSVFVCGKFKCMSRKPCREENLQESDFFQRWDRKCVKPGKS